MNKTMTWNSTAFQQCVAYRRGNDAKQLKSITHRPGRKVCVGPIAGMQTQHMRSCFVAEPSGTGKPPSTTVSSAELNILGSGWGEVDSGRTALNLTDFRNERQESYSRQQLPLREVNHGAAAARGGPKNEMQDRYTALTDFGSHALTALESNTRSEVSPSPHSPACADNTHSSSMGSSLAATTATYVRASPHVVAAARVTSLRLCGDDQSTASMGLPAVPVDIDQLQSSATSRASSSSSRNSSVDGCGSSTDGGAGAGTNVMNRLSPELQQLVASLPSSFAGVFDGHSGAHTATRAAARLQQLVAANLDLWATIAPAALTTTVDPAELDAVREAFKDAFRALDAECLDAARGGVHAIDGSTALAGLQVGMKLYVANAGDCRAVLGRGGEALSLSCDHKPELDVERARIEAAGGIVHQVRGTWRIVLPLGPGLGAKVCAVSRGLGDLDFKEPAPLISAEPDVTATALQPGVDTCVVYGSDGLWGVLTDQDAVDIVDMVCADVRAANEGHVPARVLANAAARTLVRMAQDRGSCDDITAVVTLFDWDPNASGAAQRSVCTGVACA